MTKLPGKTPLWLSIAAELRDAIAQGQYAPGARLPTEAALAGRFGVNRHTVRHALAKLRDDGLVHTRRGAGAFVLARPLDYPIGQRVRFHRNLRDAGRLPGKRVLELEQRGATAAEAARLALEPGADIAVSHTVSLAEDTPLAVAESLFPEARLPGLAAALRVETSVTAALAQVGVHDYVRAWTRLSATLATPIQASHLRLAEGAPLLQTAALSTSGGVPVEYSRTWFASDRITLALDHST
ncbi:MAG: phosphonate metabolism transcriptional regulator PhnF [Pseudomonadota bacterium]